MDVEQKVEITLKEYLELKEIKDHAKEVKITETYQYIHDDYSYNHTGSSIGWKSDGKCWVQLAEKLKRQGIVIKDKHEELVDIKELVEKINIFNLKDIKKEIDKL